MKNTSTRIKTRTKPFPERTEEGILLINKHSRHHQTIDTLEHLHVSSWF